MSGQGCWKLLELIGKTLKMLFDLFLDIIHILDPREAVAGGVRSPRSWRCCRDWKSCVVMSEAPEMSWTEQV